MLALHARPVPVGAAAQARNLTVGGDASDQRSQAATRVVDDMRHRLRMRKTHKRE